MRPLRATGEIAGEGFGQAFQFGERLGAGQAQGYLPGVIMVLVEPAQGALEGRVGHRQAIAITGVEGAQRVFGVQASEQGKLPLGGRIPGPGEKLGVQHFPLTQLIGQCQARPGEHITQALQAFGEGLGGEFKEEVGTALTSARIDLAAMALHIGHQPIGGGEALGAEKEQVFEKVREPWPGPRHIMAARRYAQCRGAALEARRMA